ncbi:aminotransferase class IV [Paramaledivibacter caminithermalis]|jgi:4-amino-4-deoxychorismate lyase|uniref:4-amino-4-deoxychorismate lyase n=1 Tax=Paramaledivibacter caminithermalis (strain DSM 15212 / CIP 107654 / DViRD3) TaxID=1121301 RepID=A0A1M6NPY4_PARC5|nr:aminotransferase class IV [Paramaledivibacter caminithermalis]SHJ97773.1 4-amino-4-deoxychorismate lyase [Paramaledivibacter caminithermalis DSM 15212]
MYISLNGKLLTENKTQISPESEAFLYGYGLFETIKILNGTMYFFNEHIERMKEGCSILNLKLIYDEDNIKKYCCELIERNNLKNGGIRISYSKNKNSYILLISTRQQRYMEDDYKKGFKLSFSHIKRNIYSPLVYIKSNNYLENILARQRALKKGFDEAIFFNVNEKLCEGTISNIFFIKDKIIYTPDIKCGILPGILRDKVIEVIKKLQLNLFIGEFDKQQLYTADEIFLTNSLMDVMPVAELEDRKFDVGNNKLTEILMREINKLYR